MFGGLVYSAAVYPGHICKIDPCAEHRLHGFASYFGDLFRVWSLHFEVHGIIERLFGAFGNDLKIAVAYAGGAQRTMLAILIAAAVYL